MIGQTRLLDTLIKVVKRADAEAISISAVARTRQVLRFAHEAIHQNLAQEGVHVIVRIIHNNRVGIASTESLNPTRLSRCVQAAKEIARHSPAQAELPKLPLAHKIRSQEDYDLFTAQMSPRVCVTVLKRLFQYSKGVGATLAGSLVTGADELSVVNSAGIACYAASTIAGVKLVTLYRRLSGYASASHRSFKQLNFESLLKRTLEQSLHRQEPLDLALGNYEVILEPEAVADLVSWLGYIAFGAKSVQERMSFLVGRMGDQVCDRKITLIDDATDPETLRVPFDFEGVPKERVVLIDEGKASGIVYDTTYGDRFGQPSTGHAMPADEVDGPLPLHLVMSPGRDNLQDMIRSCKRGLWIPRFHYVNGLLNQRETLMTGLTREGTFLIENGKRANPVTTLRFTQNLLESLGGVLGISRERRLIASPSEEMGCAVMPALHLAQFRFTGRSES